MTGTTTGTPTSSPGTAPRGTSTSTPARQRRVLRPQYLGSGWNGRNAFAAPEFYAGVNALFARTTDGMLLDYDSVGDGVLNGNHVYVAGTGWGPFTITG